VLGVDLDKGAAVRCSHMAILTTTVAGHGAYGCRACYLRLQGVLPTVAGRASYGCRACYLRLQVRCSDWEAAALTAEQARCI